MNVSIIKIGGNVIDFPEKLDEFLELFAQFPGKKNTRTWRWSNGFQIW